MLSRIDRRFIEAASAVHDAPKSGDVAFMARELVQCTLPHRDPGDVPHWTRRNGDFVLTLTRTQLNESTNQLVGFPYGSLPRLLLFWLTTEAVRTGSRKLSLGSSYADFLSSLGLANNGGQRGDRTRMREQMNRLFGSNLSFVQIGQREQLSGERRGNMPVAHSSELWWTTKRPDQLALFDSWVELGEAFFNGITSAPVPLDVRALRALKRSPLALDLYAWATHRAFGASQQGKPQRILWHQLSNQFGAEYSTIADFKKAAMGALVRVQSVYPALRLEQVTGGLLIRPNSRTAVPSTTRRR